MAVQDPTKKKRETIPNTGAYGYDVTGGGGGGGGGGSAPPAPTAPTGYGAGAAVNRFLRAPTTQTAQGESYRAQGAAISSAAAPVRNFVRGLFGAAPDTAPAAAPAAPSRQLPGAAAPAAPNNVTVSSARGGVSTSNSGGSAGAGVIPASSRRAPALRPGDVNTFTGANGVTRAVPGMNVQPGSDAANTVAGTSPAVNRALPPAPGVTAVAAPQPAAPAVYGRSLSGDLSGAERERAAALAGIDNQLLRVKPNTRGRREFIADLIGLKRQLTGERVDQATTLASQGAQLDNTAAIEAAQLAQRTGEANANRTLDAARINVDAQGQADRNRSASQVLIDSNGHANVLRNDGSLTPLTDAEGKPFQPQQDPQLARSLTVSPDVQYKALSDQLTQLQQFGPQEGQEEAYNKQVTDLQAQLAALTSGGGASKKTVVRTGTQNGRKVVQYADGSIEYAE